MVQGPLLLLILVVVILFIVVSASIFRLHPFISLLLATFFVGFAVGMPLPTIVQSIGSGFGNLMSNVGLVIVLGTIIGTILDKSNAALTIATLLIRLFGRQQPAAAMATIGAVVGIPVFCDSGFVVLAGLGKRLARQAGTNPAGVAVALAGGLYTTHTLVPPTPGPVAAAGTLGAGGDLGLVILLGVLTSIPVVLVAHAYSSWATRNITLEPTTKPKASAEDSEQPLPSLTNALLPILVPLLLIALSSAVGLFSLPGEALGRLVGFLGHPMVALLVGVLLAFRLFPRWDEEHLTGWIGEGIWQSGQILLVTGAGGALGALLKATPFTELVEDFVQNVQASGSLFLVIAFLVAALLKSAQGSSTAALVIASALLAPLLPVAGIDTSTEVAWIVIALGGGAMTVSHANDSFFWVVSQFTGLSLRDAYRSYTVMTLLMGLTVLLISLIVFSAMA